MPTSRADLSGSDKLVSLDRLPALGSNGAGSAQTVLCHGVFDLLHPGHVSHLQQARALGDRLVVSVVADAAVRGGPGRPVFTQEMRAQTLAALSCVDHLVFVDDPSAVTAIELLRPAIYCAGTEYQDPSSDASGDFARERERVEQVGGEVRLLGAPVASSTQLTNRHFDALPEPARVFAEDFRARHGEESIRDVISELEGLSVLVIGEVIVDEYIECDVQGVTLKERVPSVREISRARHWGGSYAIARHLAEVCGSVSLASIGDGALEFDDGAAIRHVAVEDPAANTILKQRYVHENKLRAELAKVFAVHRMFDPRGVSAQSRARFRDTLREQMAAHDLVVVADYGHGLLDQETIDVIEAEAPYLALNCQTNSSNFGFNLITKYSRADTFCLDQTELRLAFQEAGDGRDEELLLGLRDHLGSARGWLTMGAAGALAVDGDRQTHRAPALTLHARDTLGAGDAFFSLASACAKLGHEPAIGSLLGNAAGALAVNITGNARPVEKLELLEFCSSVLNV